MALYYFHLRNHEGRLLDPQGRAIEDPSKIAAMALHEARSLIAHDALEGFINLDQRIEVEDAAGQVVHRLFFADAVRVQGGRAS